jgi:AcrR family transcriptional regulator
MLAIRLPNGIGASPGGKTMSAEALIERPAPAADEDSVKRRQIVDGARRIFLSQGYDAASMGEIARAAGVSKGTLYVYFENKEQLFDAIVMAESCGQAETAILVDENNPDLEDALLKIGVNFVHFLCRPQKVSALRTVVAIGERMPELGRKFYAQGPLQGIARLSGYFHTQITAGKLRIDDPEIAAAQFLDSCQSTLFKPMIFNAAPAPSEEQIAHVVRMAVRTFLAAYKV